VSPNEMKLRVILSQMLVVPIETISDETSNTTVEAWDSVKQLNIVLTLEEQFGVSFDEQLALDIVSLPLIRKALVDYGIPF
jgi:acyl carrier protein